MSSTGKSEAAAGPISTSTTELFGGDNSANSKIYNALNPTPLHKETAAERRERTEDTNDIGVAGSRGGGGLGGGDGDGDGEEVVSGFGGDGDDDDEDDDWSDDGEFDDGDLDLDPMFAANLAKSRSKRDAEEKANAGNLKEQFAAQQAKTEAAKSKEMAVINARKKIEKKAAEKALAQIIADSKRRVGSITFDMSFFLGADADGDGMMSLEEALAQGVSKETFLAMDDDGNGQVTKEEFQAWMEQGPEVMAAKAAHKKALANLGKRRKYPSVKRGSFHRRPEFAGGPVTYARASIKRAPTFKLDKYDAEGNLKPENVRVAEARVETENVDLRAELLRLRRELAVKTFQSFAWGAEFEKSDDQYENTSSCTIC